MLLGSLVDDLYKELNISKKAYKELEYFCLQYREKKLEIENFCYISSVKYGFRPSNRTGSDTTLTNVQRMVSLKKDVEMIEKSAREADRRISRYIIRNVTERVQYEHMNVPCGRRQFYEKRKLFFCILYMKKRKLMSE